MKYVELLSPAKDAEIGIEAFNHGADAVYIGAPRFSARAAAGNSIQDIERLAAYGHQYGARTIVALNTIMHDEELTEAEKMAWQLYEAGCDALIIQDLGLLKLNMPPIELHASTQTDNRTIEKVKLLHNLGMTRVVMARELTVEQIRAIHEAVPDVELECFIYGALCVCVSGQCYLSAALTGRSANRGECAQPCRLPMDLVNAKGDVLITQKHLLSLKDMNRSQYLKQLIDAGVTSLKIEGRLKDMSYVKNVTAYYRKLLDKILDDSYKHVSEGVCTYTFEPRIAASFNRGFTDYQNPRESYWNFETPKSIGEKIGTVEKVKKDCFIVSLQDGIELNNGDGMVVNSFGFRANRIDNKNIVFPAKREILTNLKPGQEIYRNQDSKLEQILSKPSAKRKILVDVELELDGQNAKLKFGEVEESAGPFESASKPQRENYQKQLSKLGDTIFEVGSFKITSSSERPDLFIPSSILAEMRRKAVADLTKKRAEIDEQRRHSFTAPDYQSNAKSLDANGIIPTDFRANALNRNAHEILQMLHLQNVDDAFENQPNTDHPVMVTRHCLKYALGHCPKHQIPASLDYDISKDKWVEPMSLVIGGKKINLNFGCKNDCMCEIFTKFAPHTNK